MRLFVLLTSWVKFGSTQVVDQCVLPVCSTGNCAVVEVECENTCTTGIFGGTDVTDCAEAEKVNKGNCDATTCVPLPGCETIQACSTNDCTLTETKCLDTNGAEMTQSCGFAECGNVQTATATEKYNVWCTPQGMTVVVLDSVFEALNIDPATTTVDGPIVYPCQEINFINNQFGFMYYFLPINTDCGTTAATADNKITFTNAVKGTPRAGGIISRGADFKLEVTCTFDIQKELQVGIINPQAQAAIQESDNELGDFDANFVLYKSIEFKEPQPAKFDIVVPELLFGQVETIGTRDNIVILLQKCWATPTSADTDKGPNFIENFEAVVGEKAVIISTTPGSLAQFTLESFTWTVTSFKEIYLNCEVLLCDNQIDVNNCKRPIGISGRRRRSVETAEENFKTIQIGPIGI